MNLTASETRVLGCLLEKQHTTPDQYPLSLNALRLACNQSTNRDPVVEYDDVVLRDALHRLERRGYTRFASGAGSRTPKYRHLLAEALPMGEDEQAVMCVLMLRGAQTPGELKQRADRMHSFGELGEVHATLERLIARELVARLERRPGQKEERYVQLLEDPDAPAAAAVAVSAAATAGAGIPTGPGHGPGPEGVGGATTHAPPSSSSSLASSSGSWGRVQGGSLTSSFSADGVLAALGELTERVARLERELAELRASGDADELRVTGDAEHEDPVTPEHDDPAASDYEDPVPWQP